MEFKTIFSGNFEFGSQRSFVRLVQMCEHRIENYYKSDVLINLEDFFDEEGFALRIPRLITKGGDKSWRNTINLIEFIAQYAVAGSMNAWMVEDGKVLKQNHVEPVSDKAAVQSFLKGRELISEKGRETEAMEALSKAISKFERHGLAYERRGHVNYLLNNFDDAIYDFSKCININPNYAAAYMGRALVYIVKEDYQAAITDLEKAIKRSIPLQPVYWKARRIKSDCHLALDDYESAIFELKLFTKRQFEKDNPNYRYNGKAFFNYGKALLAVGEYDEAIKALDEAIKFEDIEEKLAADRLYFRGKAMKEAGKSGFEKDLKAAADRGSQRAAELLEEIA